MVQVAATEIRKYLRRIGQEGLVTEDRSKYVNIENIRTPETAYRQHLSWLKDGREVPPEWNGQVLLVPQNTPHPVPKGGHSYMVISCLNTRLAYMQVVHALFADLVKNSSVLLPAPGVPRGARIHETALLGEAGQGWEWDESAGGWIEMPHVGGVFVHPGVVIGPYSTIMRGVIGNTIIGDGTKIGHHVNIGHGTWVGKDCMIVAHATVGGSCRIGNRVTVWQNASIAHGVKIGDGATVGMGSVITKDVPAGETWVGNPGRKIR